MILSKIVQQFSEVRGSSDTLWWSRTQNTIYRYGGEVSDANGTRAANAAVCTASVPPESIWQFKPDGHGSGNWTEALGPTGRAPWPQGFISIAHGASSSGDDHGYYIGGYASPLTTQVFGDLPFATLRQIPGIIDFSFDNLSLANGSDGGFFASQYQNKSAIFDPGNMILVPSFGADGVIILLGGSGHTSLPFADDFEPGVGQFNNITIYDLHTQSWLWQTATSAVGSPPSPRGAFCAVGVQGGDNSTYEIFIHGGVINNQLGPSNADADEIYVISLPSFEWFPVDYPSSHPRAGHKCIASGTNQMVLIGGLNPTDANSLLQEAFNGSADPWVQGLGVFDMTSLQWKSSYQADASPYTPSGIVKDYYASVNGSRFPSSWSSTAVQALFQNNATTPNPNPPSESSSSTLPSPPASPTHGSRNAIIGGVVGGAAALALLIIGGVIFRRRARRVAGKGDDNRTEPVLENDTLAPQISTEPKVSQGISEMPATEQPSEIYGRQLWEMAVVERPVEMAIHGR